MKAELLEKENLKLKENSASLKRLEEIKERNQITMDDEEYTPQTIKREKKRETLPMVIDYKLLLYSAIGIGGLGLYIYNQRKNIESRRAEGLTCSLSRVDPPLRGPLEKKEKEEIDPFEF